MKFSRFPLFGFLAGFLGLFLAPFAAQAQQTITATSGQVGVAYSYQVTSTAQAPYQFGATGLPAGLAINQSSGLITGTPTTAGTFTGNVSVTSNGQTNNATISITIAGAANTPVINSPATASGTVGTAFTYNSSATNSPTSYNITGLPAGLSANSTSGVITGTPVAAGTSSISISGNNSGGTGAAITLTLTVAAPASAPVISSPTTASSPLNTAFSYAIAASGTPTSFAASGLPLGLSLDTVTGVISGTPTVAGVYTIGLTATNGGGTSATVNLTLTVGSLSSITSSTTAVGGVGATFTYNTTASNSPTSYNIAGLPAGLTANTTTGVISGTPTTAATSSITLSANNASGTGPTTTLTLTVGNRPVINSVLTATGTAGAAFTYTITATNSPTSFGATGLPTGLTLSGAVISGTPAAPGVSTVTLTATNNFGTSASASLQLTIAAAPVLGPVFTNAISATGITNVPFSFANTTSPAATSYAMSGNVPAGLTINATTGVISGTVTTEGTYAFTVTAANSTGNTSRTLTLFFNALPVITSQPQSASVAAGGSVTLNVVATSTVAPTYQWFKNGIAISGASGASLALSNVQLGDVGSYLVSVTNTAGTVNSRAAAVGVTSTAKVSGSGSVVGTDIVHPNGNVFDQLLLTGTSASLTADTNKVTRISFIDLNDDIVQVEYSGPGTVTLTLENPTGPATPVKYNQPGVSYMKGHASLIITGANENSNLTVFTLGPSTGFNPALFPAGMTYDGVADLGLISIATTNGKFGGIRVANASFFRSAGLTGISAPGVAVQGPVYLSDITADANATGVLVFGSTTEVRITGGDLQQLNNRAIQVDGITRLNFTAGAKSNGSALPVQANKGRLEQNGTDVTSQLVPP